MRKTGQNRFVIKFYWSSLLTRDAVVSEKEAKSFYEKTRTYINMMIHTVFVISS
ncbi:hypothetical protein ACEQPO_31160 [Bacillus sp. SL00103]